MRKVYMSFLGLGFFDKEKKEYRYNPATYELNNAVSQKTEFVQVAEMELLNGKEFDFVLIIATKKSYETHFANLEMQMNNVEVFPVHLEIEEKMDSKSQWQWFEKILSYVEFGDELTIDMTHGYRSVPIVFSAAVNFLQKAKNIKVNAVYYGAYDTNIKPAPIVDMKDFYNINEWAEAVTRLVEDADARKMAEVAGKTSEFQMGELNDPEVIKTFDELTNSIRNVDVNNVTEKAEEAIVLIREKKKYASETGKILLDLVIDKFVYLTTGEPVSGMYDKAYFNIQLKIVRLLLEHRLYMQAYTVMRELIGSIGMIPVSDGKMNSSKGRSRRYRYAEVFVVMVRLNEWKFEGQHKDNCEILTPFYHLLTDFGIIDLLKEFIEKLTCYRNGFSHAWTSKAVKEDIHNFGEDCFDKLTQVVRLLEIHILNNDSLIQKGKTS